MTKRKNNYKISDEQIIEAVKNNTSIRRTLQSLGLCDTGTAYRNLKRRIATLQISTLHFVGQAHLRGKSHDWAPKRSMKKILIKNSGYENIASLKKRLLNEGYLQNRCYICNLMAEWNGKPLSLQLDHINGIYNDHRIENLRLLCPNCHSQTETFAGKNIGAEGGSRTLTVLPGAF